MNDLRRTAETPPGAQGQADWSTWPRVPLRSGPEELYALHLVLSWSRMEAVVWSPRKDLLAWLHGHNEAFRRLGGVPGVLRIDNEKTAIVSGAGPWGRVHPVYAAYARTLRFHVDAARPYAPGDKGKVERRIGDGRLWLLPPARLALADVEVANRLAAAATVVARASRVQRDANGLLRSALSALGEQDDVPIDEMVSAAAEQLGDDDPVWRLADRIARLRRTDPDDLELAIDWLDALLDRSERRAAGRRRRS